MSTTKAKQSGLSNSSITGSPARPDKYRKPMDEYHAFQEPEPPAPPAELIAASFNGEKWDLRIEALFKKLLQLCDLEKTQAAEISKQEKRLGELAEEIKFIVYPPPPPPEPVDKKSKSASAKAASTKLSSSSSSRGNKRNVKTPTPPPPEEPSPEEEKKKIKMLNLLMSVFMKKKLNFAPKKQPNFIPGFSTRANNEASSPTIKVSFAGGDGHSTTEQQQQQQQQQQDQQENNENSEQKDQENDIPGKPEWIDAEAWRKMLALREERLNIEYQLDTMKDMLQATQQRIDLLSTMADLSNYSCDSAQKIKERFAGTQFVAATGGSSAFVFGGGNSSSVSGHTSARSGSHHPHSGRRKSGTTLG